MKTELNVNYLKGILPALNRVVGSGRSSLPVCGCILIETDGDCTTLTANNLEEEIRHATPVGGNPGGIAINANILSSFINSLPADAAAVFELTDNACNISCENASATLLGYPPDEFPTSTLATEYRTVTLSADDLRLAIARTVFACASDTSKPILTCVHIHSDTDRFVFVGTDAHRMSIQSVSVNESTQDFALNVPAPALRNMIHVLPVDSDVTLRFSEHQLTVVTEDTFHTARTLDGKYLTYMRVFPADTSPLFSVQREAAIDAVKRVSMIARECADRIILSSFAGRLTIFTEASSTGSATSEIDVVAERDIKIALNYKYLLELLNTLQAGTVTFSAEGDNPNAPLLVTDGGFKHVLMPIQIASQP